MIVIYQLYISIVSNILPSTVIRFIYTADLLDRLQVFFILYFFLTEDWQQKLNSFKQQVKNYKQRIFTILLLNFFGVQMRAV